MQFRLLRKFMMFMDIIQYQYVWHKAGSSLFNPETFMSKMHFAGRPFTGKVDEIMEKVKQDRPKLNISGHDIGNELNIDHKTVLNHLEKAEYKKN